MKSALRLLLLVTLLLNACAHQEVEPSLTANQGESVEGSHVGVAASALAADVVIAYMARESQALGQLISVYNANDWQLTQLADGSIRMQSTTAFAFDTGSAELRPSALDVWAKLAQIAQNYDQTVMHIAASASDASPVDYRQSLSDRRASALLAFFSEQGIDGMRLRAEGLVSPRADGVIILIKPIVAGSERQAWMSPS